MGIVQRLLLAAVAACSIVPLGLLLESNLAARWSYAAVFGALVMCPLTQTSDGHWWRYPLLCALSALAFEVAIQLAVHLDGERWPMVLAGAASALLVAAAMRWIGALPLAAAHLPLLLGCGAVGGTLFATLMPMTDARQWLPDALQQVLPYLGWQLLVCLALAAALPARTISGSFSGRPWAEWIARYGTSHRHRWNRHAHSVGIPLIVVGLYLYALAIVDQSLWVSATWFFGLGWALQFVGHALERTWPEFFSDWRFLLVGLRWWWSKMSAQKRSV